MVAVKKGERQMNHVKTSQEAWKQAVGAAKASHRGLQIWPGDQYRITLDDLPVLEEGWSANLQGRKWDILAISTTEEIRDAVKIGRSYALGLPTPDSKGYFMVVEQ